MKQPTKQHPKKNNYELVSTEGEFSLYVASPVYKSYIIPQGYVKNTKTGENCGHEVYLRKHFYVNGQYLEEPVLDEDCYEFVFGESNNE